MEDNTSWTPSSNDNLLGLTDKNEINEHEAKGIASAELYVFELDSEIKISTPLILNIHKIAFGALYSWAGKWRTTQVMVGEFMPPEPNQVIQLMYQFTDNLNNKVNITKSRHDHIDCLAFAHYEFVKIHPFNNGNGRTGRILMNLVGLKFGYQPLQLYHRKGDSRAIYINSIKLADKGNFESLKMLIAEELTAF